MVMAQDPQDAARQRWIKAVLGLDLASAASGQDAARKWQAARASFAAADASVANQLEILRTAMQRSPGFAALAQFSLDGTEIDAKRLLAALPAFPPDARGTQAVAAAIASFRRVLDADEVIAACDDNPLGAKVAIRATYAHALAALTAAIAA